MTIYNNSANGFFYKIKDPENKTRGYMLGVITGGDPDKLPDRFSEPVNQKMNKVANLMVKIDLDKHGRKTPICRFSSVCDEGSLQEKARIGKINIKELETSAYYDSIGVKAYHDMTKTLSSLKDPDVLNSFECPFTLNEIQMEAFTRVVVSPEFAKECYDLRNANMADKIDVFLREEGKHMVAIDAANIVGEKGVNALLREKGWRIERIAKDVYVF